MLVSETPSGGRGTDYGTLLHQVFEAATSGLLPSDVRSYVYSEVPFVRPIEDGTGTIMRGTIDLIVRLEDGWKIVDFKTHHADTDEAVEALRLHYSGQLMHYVNAWAELTGESVVDAGLWLTERGQYVSVLSP